MITKPKTGYIKNAIFLSYTGLRDFLNCPRAYFLKNIYRDPKTGNKIQIASPYLTLGSCVHDAIKWFLQMKGQVTARQLEEKFRNLWLKYRGKRGGFSTKDEEASFGKRGLLMLSNFFKNANALEPRALFLDFPKFNLFEDVILMGNLDFVGERQDGTLHVLDFKTGQKDEVDELQLYIYAILAETNFAKPVSRASYWYLDREDTPREVFLGPLDEKLSWLGEQAKLVKEALAKNEWVCQKSPAPDGTGLCWDCKNYQAILDGKGEFLFSDDRYGKDVYFLPKST